MKNLLVNPAAQTAVLYDGSVPMKTYIVSTAKNGLGCAPNSLCTPFGKLRIAKKIGDGLGIGTVLRGRKPTGKFWSSDPANPLSASQEDLVLSRILWLEGCEAQNANTFDRCIYIHGTNREDLLGTPASHGCIRLSNKDVIDLFDLVQVGDSVEIA